MPFIIHSLGDRMYGMWILVSSFLSFYWLFNIGLGPATQRYVSKALGHNNLEDANTYINTSFAVYALLGILVFAFTIIAAIGLPLFVTNNNEISLLRSIIIILGGNFALGMPMRVFTGVLSVHLRYDIISTIGIVKDVIRVCLILVLLKNGYGILSLAAIHVLTDIFEYVVGFIYAKMIANYFKIGFKQLDKKRLRELFSYSWIALGIQITDRLRFNIDSFIIAGYLGAEKVTIYTIAYRLIDYYRQSVSSALGMLMPIFSRMEAEGDIENVKEKFQFVTKISIYFSIYIAGSLIIFGEFLITAWVGPRFIFAYTLLLILVVPSTFNIMQNPSVDLMFGISKHRDYLTLTAVEAILNLTLSIILAPIYGLIGVAFGAAIPTIFTRLVLQPMYACKAIGLSLRAYYIDISVSVMKASVLVFLYYLLAINYLTTDLINLIFFAVILFSIFTLSLFYIGFDKKEKDLLLKLTFLSTKS